MKVSFIVTAFTAEEPDVSYSVWEKPSQWPPSGDVGEKNASRSISCYISSNEIIKRVNEAAGTKAVCQRWKQLHLFLKF